MLISLDIQVNVISAIKLPICYCSLQTKRKMKKKKGKIKKLFLTREAAEGPSASQGVTDRPSEN